MSPIPALLDASHTDEPALLWPHPILRVDHLPRCPHTMTMATHCPPCRSALHEHPRLPVMRPPCRAAMPAHHDDGYPPPTTSSLGARTPRRWLPTCATSSRAGRGASGLRMPHPELRTDEADGSADAASASRTLHSCSCSCSHCPLQPTRTHRLHVQSVLHMQHCAAWRRIVPGVAWQVWVWRGSDILDPYPYPMYLWVRLMRITRLS
jgi:hypothetical protein